MDRRAEPPHHDHATADHRPHPLRRSPRQRFLLSAILVGALAVAATVAIVAPQAPRTAARAPDAMQTGPVSVFVPISPFRAYDSRVSDDENGPIFLLEQRFVRADTDVDGVRRLPDEATAVTFNVTVTDTVGTGFVQIFTADQPLGSTSTVNWTDTGQTDSNAGHIRLFEGPLENQLGFHVGGAGGSGTHVVIDITGYYVPAP